MGNVDAIPVLFVGLGASRISWYRCVTPSFYMNADWIGVGGQPPKLAYATGYVKGATQMARWEDYRCIIVQQPRGYGWSKLIAQLQSKGIKVLYEIDDYAHAIRKQKDHDFRSEFDHTALKQMEMCMRRCDGLIASTKFIALKYRKFNPRTWVCENGLDLGRYQLSRPTHRPLIEGKPSVTIVWSGATAHKLAALPWLNVIAGLMRRYPQLRFASVGADLARPLQAEFGARALCVPFAFLETYPAAMMVGDIAIAPAGSSGFYRGKSALRAMEAAALGIPVVADRSLYEPAVLDGETGLLVDTPAEAQESLERLIQDESLRLRMGDLARAHAISTFDMRVRVGQWRDAIASVLGL